MNPIYGLACPNKQIVETTVLSPNQTKCGCKTRQYVKQSPISIRVMEVGSQIFDSVTGNPFDSQTVHIQNLDNGVKTVTQENGQFVIAAEPTDTLKITHVGYGEIIITASELTDKIVLNETFDTLDEVELKPKKQVKAGLVVLGLATALALVYASADEEKKTS